MQAALNFLKTLESIRSPFLDTLVGLITRLGEEVIVLGVICIMFWCINKDSAYKLGITFFTSGIIVQALKVSFRIERPWVLDKSLKPVESAVPAATGYSFPSGHTQSAASLYGFIASECDKRTRKSKVIFGIMILLVALVGFSRMYLGVHTYFDVLCALGVTIISIVLISSLWNIISKPANIIFTSVALGAISVGLCVYSYILYKSGSVPAEQIADCFKSGGAGLGFAIGFFIERKYICFSVKAKSIWLQVAKCAVGIGGALALKSLPKLIAEGSLAVDFSRYLLTVLWVIVLYPILFSKILKANGETSQK